MKKRDLVLDFTSLLDVIMIILFVVVSSMGQASYEAKEEAREAVAESEIIKEDMATMEQDMSAMQQSVASMQSEKESVEEEKATLEEKIQELEKENRELRAENGRSDVDEAAMYEMLMKKSTKMTLICTTKADSSDESVSTDGNAFSKVEIALYRGNIGEEQQSVDKVTFVHDFSLSQDERAEANALMQKDLYDSIKKAIGSTDAKLILFTVEYTYSDKDFSQADLDIISEAIGDIERYLGVTCYIDKVKK